MEIIWVNIAHMKDKEGNSKESGSMFHVTEDIRSEWYRVVCVADFIFCLF